MQVNYKLQFIIMLKSIACGRRIEYIKPDRDKSTFK